MDSSLDRGDINIYKGSEMSKGMAHEGKPRPVLCDWRQGVGGIKGQAVELGGAK